ncbi:MAG: hypothetical protein LBH70_08235 [Spirochaetaceae bacterium]|nr:hypothetical protein [Spirochaetaceae bacterium]
MPKESPHFFCEGCGAEVPLQAANCPQCGRFFQAVRCPACGFTGEEALFTGGPAPGCPVCGYSLSAGSGGTRRPPKTGRKPDAGKRKDAAAGAPPLWVYLLASVGFIGVCTVLFTLLKN